MTPWTSTTRAASSSRSSSNSWIESRVSTGRRLAGHDGGMRHPVAPRLPATAAHVFVDDVENPVLLADDAHHLARVLRLRDGEEMTVSDGRGAWRLCRFHANALAPAAPTQHCEPPTPPVLVAFALTKGDKPELIVQKLTELGVDRIVPVAAARSVVQWEPAKAA